MTRNFGKPNPDIVARKRKLKQAQAKFAGESGKTAEQLTAIQRQLRADFYARKGEPCPQ